MLNAACMTTPVVLYKKGLAGTTPEAWVRVGGTRRAQIMHLTAGDSIEKSARWNANVTHEGWLDAADDFESVGGGSRLLKRLRDGQNFLLVGSEEAGKRLRAGRTRYTKVSLSEISPAVV